MMFGVLDKYTMLSTDNNVDIQLFGYPLEQHYWGDSSDYTQDTYVVQSLLIINNQSGMIIVVLANK